jgi:small subunit ribosomal protein S7
MAGRITASEKQLQPDPRYGDKVLAKFINCVMLKGKKAVAQRVVYDALDKIKARMDRDKREGMPENVIDVFRQAIENVKPNVEVRSKRVGGANYQVPMPVTQRRRQSLAFRWIITAVRSEKGKPMADRLAKELYDAANGDGKACTLREQTHRMAEANKAFSHFAW